MKTFYTEFMKNFMDNYSIKYANITNNLVVLV